MSTYKSNRMQELILQFLNAFLYIYMMHETTDTIEYEGKHPLTTHDDLFFSTNNQITKDDMRDGIYHF